MAGARYHLVVSRSGHECRALHAARHPHVLASYASGSALRGVLRHHLLTPEMRGRGHLLVDSGAFSALTRGLALDVRAYGAFCAALAAEHGADLAALEFINLDVIGDQAASDEHERVLRGEFGLDPVPVFTFGARLRDLEAMAARSGRVALGGLVPFAQDRATLRGWLGRCFDVLGGAGPRVHLLGIAQEWALMAYPVASCDSSSWSAVVRFGRGRPAGEGSAWKAGALEARVRDAQALEARVAARWAARAFRPGAQPGLFDAAA